MNADDIKDLVIIGGGPAGLAAGLYAARARLDTLLVEKLGYGGQLLTYEKVDNYPGFPEGISAFDLVANFQAHAARFGLESTIGEVVDLELEGPVKTVRLADRTLRARAVVIASGASPAHLGVDGETTYRGRGVSYCAVCDAPFYRDQVVAVVGGGDTAVEEALYLTKFARKVHLIHRRDRLRAFPVNQEQAFANEKIEMVWNTVVKEIKGTDQGVAQVVLEDVRSRQRSELVLDGVFIFVGIRPNGGFVPPIVRCDTLGFIETDLEMATSVPGVFAAGDIRSKRLRQIVTAVGEGATAAFNAGLYIEHELR